MLIFGLGAAAPLVLLGTLSRASMMRVLVFGVLIATGADKSLEAWILNHRPLSGSPQ